MFFFCVLLTSQSVHTDNQIQRGRVVGSTIDSTEAYRLFPIVQHILPHHLINELAYSLAEKEWPWLKNWLIHRFIAMYDIDMSDAIYQDPDDYSSFNDFFTRRLLEGTRPLPLDPSLISSPVDGTISQIGEIKNDKIIQAKQHEYNLTTLLGGNRELADTFDNGLFSTIYLSPGDYHRVHMPATGTLRQMAFVPGSLYSVNQDSVDNIDNLFARNERVISIFDTDYGPMAVIMVGAMVVGSMETVWAGEVKTGSSDILWYSYDDGSVTLARGDEMGLFKLGSTVVLLFPKAAIHWLETYSLDTKIKMGSALARPN
ncbi:MAG: phosphatidylserine decarboxylase [Endozoicomonadaceae bacterium]|nr:phosphatidylserine decarboxylase [Endozoicomonadaceae bacterium]